MFIFVGEKTPDVRSRTFVTIMQEKRIAEEQVKERGWFISD
jgi:hypothetical protein